MKEILKRDPNNSEYPYDFTISYEIVRGENGINVNVLEQVKGDDNKWHNPKVTTDILYRSYLLYDDYAERAPYMRDLDAFIAECCEEDEWFPIDDFERMAKSQTKIEISLPTSSYAIEFFDDFECVANGDAFPLRVKIDWRDKSTEFFDFDYFGDKAVDVAYEILVNGKVPNVNSARVDLSGVQRLREEIRLRAEIFNEQETPLP